VSIDLSRRKHVANVLHKHGVRLTKAMGQHLLVDRSALEGILDAAALAEEDEVLEVGPGAGVLTAELVERAKRVVAVELDRRLVGVLRETVPSAKLEIVEGDALAADPAALFGGRPYKHVANLPYGVATPLLRKLLYAPPGQRPTTLVVMVQLEVARRLAARPNDMNLLAVQVQLVADVELLFELGPEAFFPPPDVSSAVVRLTPLAGPRVPTLPTEQRFFQTVTAGFSQKRKQLHNALGTLGVGTERIQAALAQAGIRPERRAETLTLEEWSRLSPALWADASDTPPTSAEVAGTALPSSSAYSAP
jgi:16S rRNA (adenine1518-N6/adenine1519-N6)-dimethyltransferase